MKRRAAIDGNNSVDMLMVLRGAACLIVLLSHCIAFVPAFQRPELAWWIRSNGAVGMYLFFTLSGYLMGKAFWRNRYQRNLSGFANFYLNRILRIVPLYLVVIFVTSALVVPAVLLIDRTALRHLLTFTYANYPAIQQKHPVINGNLWSISTEMQFYALVPSFALLLFPLLRGGKKYFVGVMAIAFIILRSLIWRGIYTTSGAEYSSAWWGYLYSPLYSNLQFFLGGFVANAFIPLRFTERLSARARTLLLAAILCGVYLIGSYTIGINLQTADMALNYYGSVIVPSIIGIGAMLFILLAEDGSKRLTLNATNMHGNPWRALEWFGILTYGLYLWQNPVRDTLMKYWPTIPNPDANLALGFTCTFAVAMLIATLTYFGVERIAERYKRFKLSAKVAPATPVAAEEHPVPSA